MSDMIGCSWKYGFHYIPLYSFRKGTPTPCTRNLLADKLLNEADAFVKIQVLGLRRDEHPTSTYGKNQNTLPNYTYPIAYPNHPNHPNHPTCAMELQTSSPRIDAVTMVSPVQGRTWPPCTSRASDVRCHGRGRLCPDPDSIAGLQSSPDETVEHAAMLTSPVSLFLCLFCKPKVSCLSHDLRRRVACNLLQFGLSIRSVCKL